MKIIKIIDLILLFIVVTIGSIYEIFPDVIPDPLFTAMWIIGPAALIIFGAALYIENKQSKK